MDNDNDRLWAQFKNPINLPLVTNVPAIQSMGAFSSGSASEPYVTIQLTTLGGKQFLVPIAGACVQKLKAVLKQAEHLLGKPNDDAGPSTKGH